MHISGKRFFISLFIGKSRNVSYLFICLLACFFFSPDTSCENVTESIISEGLVEVRRGGIKPTE